MPTTSNGSLSVFRTSRSCYLLLALVFAAILAPIAYFAVDTVQATRDAIFLR